MAAGESITRSNRWSVVYNLHERLGMLCQLENLLLAVNSNRESLCYVSLRSAPSTGSSLFLYGMYVFTVRPSDSKTASVFSEAYRDFRGVC